MKFYLNIYVKVGTRAVEADCEKADVQGAISTLFIVNAVAKVLGGKPLLWGNFDMRLTSLRLSIQKL